MVIDLSNNNGVVNFTSLRKAGQYRVYLKRSQGADFTDGRYNGYYNGARAAGMLVGPYHYAQPSKFTPTQEVSFFAKLMSGSDIQLRPALDLEDPLIRASAAVGDWAMEWAHGCQMLLGWTPELYGSPGYIGPCFVGVSRRELLTYFNGWWQASYGRDDGKEYPMTFPAPWSEKDVDAQQYCNVGRVPGCAGPVDLSRVFNDRLNLKQPRKIPILSAVQKKELDPLG